MNLRKKKNHFSLKLTDFLNSLHQSIKEDVGWFLKKKKKKKKRKTLVDFIPQWRGFNLTQYLWGQSAINPKIKERPKCKMSTKNKKNKNRRTGCHCKRNQRKTHDQLERCKLKLTQQSQCANVISKTMKHFVPIVFSATRPTLILIIK